MPRRPLTRLELLKLATLFQGGVLILGLAIAWPTGVVFPEIWTWSQESLLWGLTATVPMLVVFAISELVDWEPLERIRGFLHNTLGAVIVRCGTLDLLYLSLLAGISEEILFRGAIQNALVPWSFTGAILITNLLFGICHAFSMAYFVLATAAGFYLSWVAGWENQNLFPAVVAHTLYDFVALLFVRREVRQAATAPLDPPAPGE
jgi:uncharacterized protein